MRPPLLLRVTSIVEAFTWAFLITSMLIRSFGDESLGQTLISWSGSAHGTVFIAYCFAVLVNWIGARWKFGIAAFGGVAAIVPFLTLLFDWFVHRKNWLPDTPKVQGAGADAHALVRWTATHPFTLAASTLAIFAFVLTMSLSGAH